jgi:hypothetical protein
MSSRPSLVAVLVVAAVSFAGAQAPIDPSGHWEGVIDAPNGPIAVEFDFVRNSSGELEGTLAVPHQHVRGLPLSNVTRDGATLRFQLGKNAGDRTYNATLSADATTMAGDYTQDGFAITFHAARKGDARVAPRPRSAPVGEELTGTWNGTLDVNGVAMRVQLVIVNEPDASSGTIANLDQGGVEVPISVIAQKASAVTLAVAAIDGSYSGKLHAEARELTGTWTQGTFSAPLSLKRTPPPNAKK